MKLGILGGTFDPIHQGHLQIAEAAYHALRLDTVLFVPAGDPPHKAGISITPVRHRTNMVALAIEEYPHFQLSLVDIERPGPHYSVDTVRLLRTKYNLAVDNCFFIIGGDSFMELPTWHKAEELLTLCRLAVIHRPGYRPDTKSISSKLPTLEASLDWVPSPAIDISASEIRANFAAEEVQYVDARVQEYIRQHGLYSSV